MNRIALDMGGNEWNTSSTEEEMNGILPHASRRSSLWYLDFRLWTSRLLQNKLLLFQATQSVILSFIVHKVGAVICAKKGRDENREAKAIRILRYPRKGGLSRDRSASFLLIWLNHSLLPPEKTWVSKQHGLQGHKHQLTFSKKKKKQPRSQYSFSFKNKFFKKGK